MDENYFRSNNSYHRTNTNQSLRISPIRAGSTSGISTASSYSFSGDNGDNNGGVSYYDSSPINSPTLAGRPTFVFTTSDRGGRIHTPTSPLSTTPTPTSQTPIPFAVNYGLPSPPITTNLTHSTPPSGSTWGGLPVPSVHTQYSSASSYSINTYTNSNYGIDTRNSYTTSSSSHSSHDNTSSVIMRPSESSSTSATAPGTGVIFPPTEEAIQAAEDELLICKSSFKVIYAGDASYKETGALLYSRSKRVHFVLTNNLLLQYKNAQKARSYINMFEQSTQPQLDAEHIFLNLAHVYAVQATKTPNTFRIDYINSRSGLPLHHRITVDSDKEMKDWIDGLRRAVKAHHPEIHCLSSSERFNIYERLKKQKDLFENDYEDKMFKAVYKEINYRAANEAPKELFVPILFAIGKFSFYLIPLKPKDQVYEKTIERDRFGLLSIQSLRYDNTDDTVILNIKKTGKPNMQIAFASTFCESIVQHLHRGLHALVPKIATTLYDRKVPSRIKNARVIQLYIHPESGDFATDDEEIQRFHTVLRGYSAAMNLDKRRFNFSIHGPMKAKAFTLLSPHEIGQSAPHYDKFELLALIKTVQYTNIFSEVSFENQPLDILEKWERKETEGWTNSKQHKLKDLSVLSNELYNMLANLDFLSKINLTNCSIGISSQNLSSGVQSSALTQIGHIMKLGKTNVTRICIGKNMLTESDFNKLIQGIREHKRPIKELCLNDCELEKDMVENVLRALYEKQPDELVILDLSLSPRHFDKIKLDRYLVEKMIPSFKQLESLRMRGHRLLDPEIGFMLEASHLNVLDLSDSKLSTENIQRLCHWIQTKSFEGIKELHLSNCSLNGKNATDILNAISQTRNRAIHLNLDNNPLMKNPGYLHQLVATLTRRPGPKSLSLGRMTFDDFALRELIEGLCTNKTITHLDLSDMSITDNEELSVETVRQFTSLFENNDTLRSLNFHYHYMKPKHLTYAAMQTKTPLGNALSKAFHGLRNNTTLNHLDISGMNIEDSGILALCRVLERNKGLRSIKLDENNISIDGYKKLSKVIEDTAKNVIHIPNPHVDLRHQLKYLQYHLEDLLVRENEAQFFIIHTTGSDATRATRHKLDTIHEEMKACKVSIKEFSNVLEKLQHVVQRNLHDYENRRQLEITYRQQRGMNYNEELHHSDAWNYPSYHYDMEIPHQSTRGSLSGGSHSPHIRRMSTNPSLGSGESANSNQRPYEFDREDFIVGGQRLAVGPIEQTSVEQSGASSEPKDNHEKELEDEIEQYRKRLQELELKRHQLRARQNTYDENSRVQEYQQNNANHSSSDTLNYADAYTQSFEDQEWENQTYKRQNLYLPPDTRD